MVSKKSITGINNLKFMDPNVIKNIPNVVAADWYFFQTIINAGYNTTILEPVLYMHQ